MAFQTITKKRAGRAAAAHGGPIVSRTKDGATLYVPATITSDAVVYAIDTERRLIALTFGADDAGEGYKISRAEAKGETKGSGRGRAAVPKEIASVIPYGYHPVELRPDPDTGLQVFSYSELQGEAAERRLEDSVEPVAAPEPGPELADAGDAEAGGFDYVGDDDDEDDISEPEPDDDDEW